MAKAKLLAFEDPAHDGNSAKYHTGKPCVTKGCLRQAGTWWSPLWCFEHNVERMNRISASLSDASHRAELAALVDKETESLRAWAYESARVIKAMVFASGGTLTIKKSDFERQPSYEGRSNNTDETITYRVGT